MSWLMSAILLCLIGIFMFMILRKSNKSGIKFMFLGISIILVGGIIAVDSNSNLEGFEYIIVLIGLILSIVGFTKSN